MISPLMFTASFMFLTILLLIGVIYSRMHWSVKAFLVLSSLLFSGFFYHGYIGSLGYPALIDPPKLFRFIYAVVHEPSVISDDPGAIYIWLMTDSSTPRSIVIPYSVENRKKVAQAKKKVQEGQIVYMGKPENQKRDGNSIGTGGQQHKSIGSSSVPYNVDGSDDLAFKPTPDTVPKKDAQ